MEVRSESETRLHNPRHSRSVGVLNPAEGPWSCGGVCVCGGVCNNVTAGMSEKHPRWTPRGLPRTTSSLSTGQRRDDVCASPLRPSPWFQAEAPRVDRGAPVNTGVIVPGERGVAAIHQQEFQDDKMENVSVGRLRPGSCPDSPERGAPGRLSYTFSEATGNEGSGGRN